MSDFKAKMHQIRFRLGLHPRPRWGSLQPCPRHPSWITGGLLLRGGKGGEGKEEREKGGKGRDEDVCKGHWNYNIRYNAQEFVLVFHCNDDHFGYILSSKIVSGSNDFGSFFLLSNIYMEAKSYTWYYIINRQRQNAA